MSDLTNNVIKAITEGKSFKEVLSSVARGFADCGFFECTNWKEIRESIFNSNVWAPDNSVNEKNDFPEANNVSELGNLLESYWNPDWDQILNISFKDYVESEQTNGQDLCNEFDIATSMFDIFAGGNSNMENNANHQTLIENNIETTCQSQFVNPTSTVEVCTEINGGKEMVTEELAMTKHVDLDPQNDDANTSQIQRISFTRDPLPLVLSPSSFEELSSLTDGTNIIHNQCNSNITDVAISISTIPIIHDRENDHKYNKDCNMPKDEKSDKKKFACDICGERFSSKRWVKRHMKQMHEERHYPVANQNYVSMPTKRLEQTEYSQIHTVLPLNPLHTDLTQNLKTHSVKKLHVCGDCQKGFSSRSGLKRHQMIHSGEKSFVCRDCPKAFSKSTHLKRHERIIHLRERPYICGDCQKAFSCRSTLKTHQLTHSGEKPHVCDVCQRAFFRRPNLQIHQETHNKRDDRKQFDCAHCERSYISKKGFELHLKKCYKEHNSKIDSESISKETFQK